MNNKKGFFSFFSELIRKNSFLKVISVLLAIVVWTYILYIVNPVNENTYDRLEVSIPYAGSVPERNGFMYLMTDTALTVNVTVSGSRSQLLQLSRSNLHAVLNMDTVVTAGTYSLPVTVTSDISGISVTEIYPKNFTIEFAEKDTKTFSVELRSSGTLPDGYVLRNINLSPTEITVTGPKTTVAEIESAYLTLSLTNLKTDVNDNFDLSLVNAAGENVDRRYLTLSEETVATQFDVRYQKTLLAAVELVNSSGGNEESYISVTLDEQQITGTGDEKLLSGYTEFIVGQIDTSVLTQSKDMILTIPQNGNVTFDPEQVTVHVAIAPGTATKTISFDAQKEITFINVPNGKTVRVTGGDLHVRIRALAEDLQKLNGDNLTCVVDLGQPNDDGSYPVIVTSAAGIPYGVLGSYSVQLELY